MAVGDEADYTFHEGEFMATSEPTTDATAPTPPQQGPINTATVDESELTPFERIVARMKGTGRIVGDIVSPDPEPWNCEIE
jgi:hypothetical protein